MAALKRKKKVENKNLELSKVKYFEGAKSVGIGSTVTNIIVGYAGSTAINKSVPPKAIYLPNHKFKNGDEVTLVSIGSTTGSGASAQAILGGEDLVGNGGARYRIKRIEYQAIVRS